MALVKTSPDGLDHFFQMTKSSPGMYKYKIASRIMRVTLAAPMYLAYICKIDKGFPRPKFQN